MIIDNIGYTEVIDNDINVQLKDGIHLIYSPGKPVFISFTKIKLMTHTDKKAIKALCQRFTANDLDYNLNELLLPKLK